MKTHLQSALIFVTLACVAFAEAPNPTMLDGQDEQIMLYNGEPPGKPVWNKTGPIPETVFDKYGYYRFVRDPAIDVFHAKGGKLTRAAVIICPGGSYSGLAFRKEGITTAKYFRDRGITAMVLRYRFAPYRYPVPMTDVQRAIQLVRSNAEKWDIDPGRIGVMGFSAGGHAASTATVNHVAADPQSDDPVRRVGSRPDFAVLVYPVITMEMPVTHAGSRKSLLGPGPNEEAVNVASSYKHVNKETPPTLLIHSKDDTAVPIKNSELFLDALKQNKVPCKMLTYEQGGHGYALGRKDTDSTAWPEECFKWMGEIGVLGERDPK